MAMTEAILTRPRRVRWTWDWGLLIITVIAGGVTWETARPRINLALRESFVIEGPILQSSISARLVAGVAASAAFVLLLGEAGMSSGISHANWAVDIEETGLLCLPRL